LSIADVEELIGKFGDAAVRAQKAGFDGVEINGSHHHLINTFFSRVWNMRRDEYGCDSLENRSRFMCNIIREVKKRCGHDFPVSSLFNAVELGATPWEGLDEYVDRSPISYAKHIATPLIIVHSEDDLRCPMGQAEQLFVALKKLGREVLFVRFPDENHELSRAGKPRHRLARFRFILDWFAKYLAPASSS